MRYLSLFSGIEAASVAWEPFGWQPVAFSEIDSFACAVLSHHYPNVPNLGDITKLTAADIAFLGPLDVVVAGWPCQDISIAGKRQGLRNDDGSSTRSGLFFDAMRIAEWADSRWLVFENVPGLFSINAGRDFAAVVGAMAGCEFDVPRDGWRNAGVVAGPLGLVEWTVLDAQYHGLAQRRRRVFLVRDSGDWASRPPLFLEPARLCGNPAPRRRSGQDVAATVTACAPGGSGYRNDGGSDVDHAQAGHLIAFGGNNTSGPIEVSTACRAHGSFHGDFESETFVTHSLTGEGFDASEDGTGRGTPLVPIAFDTTQITSRLNGSNPQPGDPCHPLAAQAHPPTIAFDARQDCISSTEVFGALGGSSPQAQAVASPRFGVRRLMPVEAEKLQGFMPGYTQVPYRGKRSADGPRYRGIGNSMAVNCMAWLGQRIQMAEQAGINQQGEANGV